MAVTAGDLLFAIGDIDGKYILEAGERLGLLREEGASSVKIEEADMKRKTIGKISKTALIAAVVAAALGITALAAVIFRTKVEPTDGLEGTWNSAGENHTVFFEDAKLYMVFDSSAPRHEYQFKANWLPSEPTNGAVGVFTEYLSNDGEGGVLPYVINSYNHTDIQGIRYCFDGKETLTKQDIWNGYERTEIVVNYTDTPHAFTIVNYLILFQPEDNYLIYIGGTDSMETLEKIADNLEIRLGGEITELYDAGSDIAWFDLGRG